MSTTIEWTDETWNPVTGCDRISPGCAHCYAKALHDMRHRAFLNGKKMPEQYSVPFEEVRCWPNRLDIPLHWRAPRLCFINSMADLFHEDVPDWFIDAVFAAAYLSPQHTFQVLTKRPERMLGWLNSSDAVWEDSERNKTAGVRRDSVLTAAFQHFSHIRADREILALQNRWPLPNLWPGVSVESKKYLYRLDRLREVPSAVRMVSFEPLLEDLGEVNLRGIGWAIAGGESGPGARPMHPDWVRSLRDQCVAQGVPFFFKQWGEWSPSQVATEHDVRAGRVRLLNRSGQGGARGSPGDEWLHPRGQKESRREARRPRVARIPQTLSQPQSDPNAKKGRGRVKCSTPKCRRQAIGNFCKLCGAQHRSTGLRASNKYKYHWTPAMDEQIRNAYLLHVTTRKRVSIKAVLGKRFGFPHWAIQQRAAKLGLCRAKEKPWTERELALLEKNSWKSESRISTILRANGFARSANAIHVKRVRWIHERRGQYPFYSSHGLAKLMGVDSHQITRWIALRFLPAERRGTERNVRQGGDEWAIRPAAVRQFLAGNPLLFDIRKVEQLWFMDLLTNDQANKLEALRERGRPKLKKAAAA